jgi:hypothetical protein
VADDDSSVFGIAPNNMIYIYVRYFVQFDLFLLLFYIF